MTGTTRITGKHVLLMLIGFFGVIIVANSIFLTFAVRSFPGESEKKSYMQGLNYNEVLNERAAQASLGWSATVTRVENASGQAVIEINMQDQNNAPLSTLAIEGVLKRPTHNDADFALSFSHVGEGVYRAETTALDLGAWDMEANAENSDGAKFDIASRIIVE